MTQRYFLSYATGPGYVVRDSKTHKTVYHSLSKSQTIAEAQKLNGFKPVDGNEETYANQVNAQ